MNSNPESVIDPPDQIKHYPYWVSVLLFIPAFIHLLIHWSLGALVLTILGIFTRPFMDQARHRDFGQCGIVLAFATYIEVLIWMRILNIDDGDLDRVVDIEGPVIISSNHPAMWDALLIIRKMGRVSCIMKKELLSNPVLRGGAQFAGFLPNAPRLKMIHTAIDRLKSGGRLLLFPEGTRTREENGEVNPFRSGLAVIAKHSKAPVLPIFIVTDSKYLGKGWPITKIPNFPISIKLEIGELQQPDAGEKTRDFCCCLEKYYRMELQKRS